ncbi:uncharacterized protein [Cicer arietinum]|uniref:uncharacterized protein n=1 Tax=Cicer arietinum TaxID=3827 RepID=UPI003CC51095
MAIRVITLLLFLFVTLSRALNLRNPFPKPEIARLAHHTYKPQLPKTVSFRPNSVFIDHVPLKLLDLRPVNRHFHKRLYSRLPIPYVNDKIVRSDAVDNPVDLQIPYGNDMIVQSDSEDKSLDLQIPVRFTRIRGGELKFPRMMMTHHHNRPHYQVYSQDNHHHHHHHHHGKSWFVKRIHEFLNLF